MPNRGLLDHRMRDGKRFLIRYNNFSNTFFFVFYCSYLPLLPQPCLLKAFHHLFLSINNMDLICEVYPLVYLNLTQCTELSMLFDFYQNCQRVQIDTYLAWKFILALNMSIRNGFFRKGLFVVFMNSVFFFPNPPKETPNHRSAQFRFCAIFFG